MNWKVGLAVLAASLAIIGWFKPKKVSAVVTTLFLALVIGVLVASTLVEIRENADRAKGKLTGLIESDISEQETEYPAVELGDGGPIFRMVGPEGNTLFPPNFLDVPFILKLRKGRVLLSTSIRDANGDIVAELADNEWNINKNNFYDRNYSKDAIEVRDRKGDVVLQARAVKDRVQF